MVHVKCNDYKTLIHELSIRFLGQEDLELLGGKFTLHFEKLLTNLDISRVLLRRQILKRQLSITSNVRQINLSNENIKYKHWCFQISKIVSQKNHVGILIYILS